MRTTPVLFNATNDSFTVRLLGHAMLRPCLHQMHLVSMWAILTSGQVLTTLGVVLSSR